MLLLNFSAIQSDFRIDEHPNFSSTIKIPNYSRNKILIDVRNKFFLQKSFSSHESFYYEADVIQFVEA